ncbi:MAG: TonB family protein [Sphingopyxis sp.]
MSLPVLPFIFMAMMTQEGGVAAPAAPPTDSAGPARSPAMVEALANQAQMARGPRLVGDFQPAYSLEQRAVGMQGQGRVSIIVTAEGYVDEASIRYSNAPPELDASALAAARLLKFTPAVDKAGKAIAVPALLPFSFEAASGHPMYAVRVEPVFSNAARAAGEHGKVVIDGKVGPDGRLVDTTVFQSSRSATLDAAALEAANASRYRLYRDGAGKPFALPVRIPFSFDNYRTPGPGGGVLRYRCDQFARDESWWAANWPANEKNEFYTMMLGLSALSQDMLSGVSQFREKKAAFDMRYAAARLECVAQPDKLFVDVMKVEGPIARRMAERAK